MKGTLVLFDVGGVLLTTDFGRFYEKAAEFSGLSADEFKEKYQNSGLEKKRLSGHLTTNQFLESLRKLIGKEISDHDLKKVWANIYKARIEDLIQLKQKLIDKGYPVGIFSNASEVGSDLIPSHLGEGIFTGSDTKLEVISSKIGSVKPEPPMYEEIKKLGFKKVIYIEDKELYLKVAIEKYRWKGILFKGRIDQKEAMRAEHSDTSLPQKDFIVARTTEELVDALRSFGIEI